MPRPRDNQRYRTRKDLLAAAARLLRAGRSPSVAEVADEARISRATAYRYFPSRDALLAEAPLDGEQPTPESLFASEGSSDPVARLDKAEAAMHRVTFANATQHRLMLARLLEHDGRDDGVEGPPLRQNRRTALIEAALAPARRRFRPAAYGKLCSALALVFGTESMIVFRDVLRLDPDAARSVKRWMIEALVAAALAEPSGSVPAARSRRRA
ncbi:MAG: helix-turn-helix domain-containing protein [Thermodesulfobacteriota bacterium]